MITGYLSVLRNNIIDIYGTTSSRAVLQLIHAVNFITHMHELRTFVTHSSPSCYVTLRTQVIRLNSGNLGPQKTDSGVFIILSCNYYAFMMCMDQ